MPNCPQEICDFIIDLSHNDPKTLKKCCLVSKSWLSRPRKYLFDRIIIHKEEDYRKWKKTFPAPTGDSPAHHTHTLVVVVKALLEGEETSWIQAFSRVRRLVLLFSPLPLDKVASEASTIASFKILAPSLEALEMSFEDGRPCPRHFDFIRSLLPLKYLTLQDYPFDIPDRCGSDKSPAGLAPLTSPVLRSILEVRSSIEFTERWVCPLLALPGGLHFTKVGLYSWDGQRNLQLLVEFMAACSDTLECLEMLGSPYGAFSTVSLFRQTYIRSLIPR